MPRMQRGVQRYASTPIAKQIVKRFLCKKKYTYKLQSKSQNCKAKIAHT